MKLLASLSLLSLAYGQFIRTTNYAAATLVKKEEVQTTAVTRCHFHDDIQFCVDGHGNEGSIVPAPTDKANAPTEYTGCHNHGDDVFCRHDGKEVEFVKLGESGHGHVTSHDNEATITTSAETTDAIQTTAVTSCHFHETVQFCVDGHGNEGSIVPAPTDKANAPTEYTGCHNHGDDVFCRHDGKEVEFVKLDENATSESSVSSTLSTTTKPSVSVTELNNAGMYGVPIAMLVVFSCLL
ncbi:uncharacterized protein SPAPADRAFT_68819 [Spathaspora passalidarum NRRL Y-27907]|uniref:Uncharacterized protein n=1 Tax=Spathaspora passalidarum (strain NRRL Y-27907 / 11-Y1) TaxID=619300 RepID=G3AVS3_SPAPN|nr:uncharacterized protein SPAPADRAFT_68819 [Spathaspora passalidarum NRRL Y-27907]EGW29968.1 hypothetical protein SPAPADRAFT_68819 [Spathaspora passalidarum NRRL Y-27907]